MRANYFDVAAAKNGCLPMQADGYPSGLS